ncbi:MAG TPA: SGNH/GDSL hydrolase family protein, partial [bacterium]|nr:SGNH/GDSL hydrolase family protein [bacterium]
MAKRTGKFIGLRLLPAISWLVVAGWGCAALPPCESAGDAVAADAAVLREVFPGLFPPELVIAVSDRVERPTVYGESEPPENYAGPDPAGVLLTGIYFPPGYGWPADRDISQRQWLFHEAIHLASRRNGICTAFVDQAFPDDNDPLVRWIARDPYHAAIAREEAFINLATMADPCRTDAQRAAVRDFYAAIGAGDQTTAAIATVLQA